MEPGLGRSVVVWMAALGVVLSAATASAQTIQAGALGLDFTGRVQVQLNSTSVDGDDLPVPPASTAFEMRRVRFGVGVAYGEWMTGKVEADLAGAGARLADGWVDVRLADPLHLQAGQFKKPFGAFELESSTRIRTIERGVRIRGLTDVVGVPGETQWLLGAGGYAGRQIGAMLHGRTGALGYAAGIFNGEGANVRETHGSKAFAGRLTWGPLESLVVGAGASVQPVVFLDGAGVDDEVHGTAVALDATWGGFRQEGLHVKAEWMVGENPTLGSPAALPTMTGVHGLMAWFQPRAGRVEGVEPVLRLGWADPDTASPRDHGLLVTPGLNLYFSGRNRLMVNGDVYLPGQEALDPELAVAAQLQVYF